MQEVQELTINSANGGIFESSFWLTEFKLGEWGGVRIESEVSLGGEIVNNESIT
jgi:hypothetical protein